MSGKTALLTGVTGQDGSYLAEQLLARGYTVHAVVRRLSVPNALNIQGLRERITVHDGDLLDQSSLDLAVRESAPDEVYNLAAQSFVGSSWKQPVLTAEITGLGALRMLEAVRRFADKARFYQAGSSEMFGSSPAPQSERTEFLPRSPYGVAKLSAHHFARTYRESYGMFVSNGILFNHESPRRGSEFVTRKISMWAAALAANRPYAIALGNVDSRRDWGYAPDYTDLMWRMLQHDRPEDFVGATGETHSVHDFLVAACDAAKIDIAGNPIGLQKWLTANAPSETRPADVLDLRGDASKAKSLLGWEPTVRFGELARKMVEADYARIAGTPPLIGGRR